MNKHFKNIMSISHESRYCFLHKEKKSMIFMIIFFFTNIIFVKRTEQNCIFSDHNLKNMIAIWNLYHILNENQLYFIHFLMHNFRFHIRSISIHDLENGKSSVYVRDIFLFKFIINRFSKGRYMMTIEKNSWVVQFPIEWKVW